MQKRLLLMGNEAVALGAYHAGVSFASAYPGTPSTEILEELSCFDGVYAEWAPNEKVAVEARLKAALNVRARVSLREPRTLERAGGKAKRILDRRE